MFDRRRGTEEYLTARRALVSDSPQPAPCRVSAVAHTLSQLARSSVASAFHGFLSGSEPLLLEQMVSSL